MKTSAKHFYKKFTIAVPSICSYNLFEIENNFDPYINMLHLKALFYVLFRHSFLEIPLFYLSQYSKSIENLVLIFFRKTTSIVQTIKKRTLVKTT